MKRIVVVIAATVSAIVLTACGAGSNRSSTITRTGNPVNTDSLSWDVDEAGWCTSLLDPNGNTIPSQNGSWHWVDLQVSNSGSQPVDTGDDQVSLIIQGSTYSADTQDVQTAGIEALPSTVQPGANELDTFFLFDTGDENPAGGAIVITDPDTGQTGKIPLTSDEATPDGTPSQQNAFWCGS